MTPLAGHAPVVPSAADGVPLPGLSHCLLVQTHGALQESARRQGQPVETHVVVEAFGAGTCVGRVGVTACCWPAARAFSVRWAYASVIVTLDGLRPGGVRATVTGVAAPAAQPVVGYWRP